MRERKWILRYKDNAGECVGSVDVRAYRTKRAALRMLRLVTRKATSQDRWWVVRRTAPARKLPESLV